LVPQTFHFWDAELLAFILLVWHNAGQ